MLRGTCICRVNHGGLFLSLGLLVQLLQLVLLSFLLLHELFHLLLFLDFLVDQLNLLVKLKFLFLSLFDELSQLVGGLLSVMIGVVGNFDDAFHFFLLDVEVL